MPRCENLVFVYGSLMSGFRMHRKLDGAAFVGRGRTTGTLLSLGEYPGLINGDASVMGEVYRFTGDSLLTAIDELERFDESDAQNSLYVRTLRHILLENGTAVDAWVYVYNMPTDDADVIESGDWKAFSSATRSARF
jgi:gamma-glutamylcyclotransferase (GGCT)/AIG2-like uncharacterized protein YtfP